MGSPYDFDKVIKKKEKDKTVDLRENFRVTRSCGNCSFYVYEGAKQGRGYCKYPNDPDKQIVKKRGEHYNFHMIHKSWPKTHSTTLCDHHKFRSQYYSIGMVSQWVKKLFDIDGNLRFDDWEDD